MLFLLNFTFSLHDNADVNVSHPSNHHFLSHSEIGNEKTPSLEKISYIAV